MDFTAKITKEYLSELDRYANKIIEIDYRKLNQKILCYKYKCMYVSIKMVNREVIQAYRTFFRPQFLDDWMYHPSNEVKPVKTTA